MARRHSTVHVLYAALLISLVAAVASSCAGAAACRYNSDCENAYCSNGSCQRDCISSAIDCPEGFICNEVAQCVPPLPDAGADTGVDAGPPDARTDSSSHPDAPGQSDAHKDASDAIATTDAAHPPDTSTGDAPEHTDGTAPLKTTLDLCASDSECAAPLLCRAYYVGGATRCTPSCSDSAACPSGERCVAVGSEEYCVLSDVGRACTAASTCSFGCLTSQEYCTMACTSGSDCPNGYGCMTVSGQSVCVKAEASCDATDTSSCIAAAACDTTLLVSGCTLVCNTASDCPQRAAGFQPWTCDSGGICRRPPDVYGPLGQGVTPTQYACDGSGDVVNICNDAQHIDFTQFIIPTPPAVSCSATTTTSGVSGDACVDSCVYQGSCAFGFACTALGSVGADRVGLCLPSLGGGEIGASCATDGDCVFGYCNRTAGTCTRDCTADGICTTGSACTASGTVPVGGEPFRRCE
jgi:hypothetical protein